MGCTGEVLGAEVGVAMAIEDLEQSGASEAAATASGEMAASLVGGMRVGCSPEVRWRI